MFNRIITNSCFVFLLLVAIDQVSKYIIRTRGGFYICNKGIAFGINLSLGVWLLLVGLIIGLIVFLGFGNFKSQITNNKQITISKSQIQNQSRFKKLGIVIWNLFEICNLRFGALAFILIFSGALSNIIDRLIFGCVIDFIDLHFWPVFNLADTMITIGGIILIIKSLKLKAKN